MKTLKRILLYPVPYWVIGLILGITVCILGIVYGPAILARHFGAVPAAAAAACPATYTWTIHDVIDEKPTAETGRIVWQHDGKLFAHEFPTQKAVGDEVMLELVFDCRAADGSQDVIPGCTCKRTGRRDLLEVTR